MGEFKKSSFGDRKKSFTSRPSGQRPPFGGSSRFHAGSSSQGRDRSQRTGFATTCSECGSSCTVPFRPNGSMPVYCDNCFGAQREGGVERRPTARNERFERPARPMTSDRRFEKREYPTTQTTRPSVDNTRYEDLKKQLEFLNSKVDRIVSILITPETTDRKSESKPTTLSAVVKKATKEAKRSKSSDTPEIKTVSKKVGAKKATAKVKPTSKKK